MKVSTFFLFVVIQFSFGCSRESPCSNQIIYDDIPQGYRNLIPYKGGEVLYFYDSNIKDTIKYTGDSDWTYSFYTDISGADCQIETRRQKRKFELTPTIGTKKITINQITLNNGFQYEFNFANTRITTTTVNFKTNLLDSLIGINKVYYNVGFYSNDMAPLTKIYGCYYSTTDGLILLYNQFGDTLWLVSK